jgi:nifR3 family TIM-barrel protein
MDGVTDAACRAITARIGHPAITFTEFTAVEGLRAGADRLLDDFAYHPDERPVIAQLFGSDPEAFIEGAAIAAALGFDGVDINMGCPAKNVTERGAGAALIRDPERAKQIVLAAREGIDRWASGETLQMLGVHPRLIPLIEERIAHIETLEGSSLERKHIPVSVKTRIGYDVVAVEDWVRELLTVHPVAITLHGRTLKQLYTGSADWEAIGRAAVIIKEAGVIVLGNGDVQSLEDGYAKMKAAGTDGFLIGRKSTGNPWIFLGRDSSLEERRETALEHARYLYALFGERGFVRIRKHLLEYTREFPGAKHVRQQLSTIKTPSDVERVLAHPELLD